MRLAPECGACAAIQLTRTLSFRTDEWRRHFPPAMGAALARYGEADNPGEVLAALYEAVDHALEDGDAYLAGKDAANAWAETWWDRHGVVLGDVAERLRLAAQANAIDAGVDTAVEGTVGRFLAVADDPAGRDDRATALAWLDAHSTARILYLLDNAGEAVFDRELMRALRARGHRLTAVVRRSAVLNDVTRREADRIRLQDVAEVRDTGSRRYGLADWTETDRLARETAGFDLLIAKGVANLETLSHRILPCPVLFLYRAKCPPAARVAGAARETAVIWWRPAGLGG